MQQTVINARDFFAEETIQNTMLSAQYRSRM